MHKTLTALRGAAMLFGCASAFMLAGCSASHTASPSHVLPGTPIFTSKGVVDPFVFSTQQSADGDHPPLTLTQCEKFGTHLHTAHAGKADASEGNEYA